MNSVALKLGVLLMAAPRLFFAGDVARALIAEPRVEAEAFTWFTLNETQEEIQRLLGAPHLAAEFGADYVSWQYRIAADADDHDHSHVLVFRKSTGKLVSVTRMYEPERAVDPFFPESESQVHALPGAGKPQYKITVRKLPGERLLVAMGVGKRGDPTGQLTILRRDAVRVFHPWLDEQLKDGQSAGAATGSR
ncbi:MAG: hypothetical protein R2762_03170 [Bryobacteraceae bacterium]